jgi:DNA phosphorothioation-associated putative methyltransferase
MTLITRQRTAIRRPDFSRPIRLALNEGLINKNTAIFDYGCGHGDDVRRLSNIGIDCTGWDPLHRPESIRRPADVVNLGYVINVIENVAERACVLREAWSLARKLLIVSARLTVDAKNDEQTAYEDGYVTRLGTFQKFYEQSELREWIDTVLGETSLPAAPGIFYVFRDSILKESFIASRFRRQTSAPRQKYSHVIFEQNRELFEPLMTFVGTRGRLPDDSEIEVAREIRERVGSLKRALSIIRHVTGLEQWNRIREERSQDLLVYLALARFGARPHFSNLPREIQLDIRALFASYRRACELADQLLFSAGKPNNIQEACRKSSVGKLTPSALYIHISALPYLSPILRVYDGCARNYIGIVDGANIIKLHYGTPQISYLYYPEFENDPHPALAASLIVPLQTFHVQYREYKDSKNPPILHRKDAFLPPDHPLRPKFARLTQQEEQYHLYDTPELIGTRNGWQSVLKNAGVQLLGHDLIAA